MCVCVIYMDDVCVCVWLCVVMLVCVLRVRVCVCWVCVCVCALSPSSTIQPSSIPSYSTFPFYSCHLPSSPLISFSLLPPSLRLSHSGFRPPSLLFFRLSQSSMFLKNSVQRMRCHSDVRSMIGICQFVCDE